MEPFLMMAAGTAIAQLFNGHMARKEQQIDREERRERYVKDREDSQRKFDLDYDLRKDRFIWDQQEAQAAITRRFQERMQEFARQDKRDQNARSFESLRRVFNASPDGWYIHDPYAGANKEVKSLRLLVQLSGVGADVNRSIENQVALSVNDYMHNKDGTPIHFPTGAWVTNAPGGSWVASELHAWDSQTPTLILRGNPGPDNTVQIYADMFGFPIGQGDFQSNAPMCQLPNDPQKIATVLSLMTMQAADIYYLSNYGRMPQLPRLLPQYLEQGKGADIQGVFIENYQDSLNTLIAQKPGAGIPIALKFAHSLLALPDHQYALRQTQAIEQMTVKILPQHDQLAQHLSQLYTAMNRPQDAERLNHHAARAQGLDRAARAKLLENLL